MISRQTRFRVPFFLSVAAACVGTLLLPLATARSADAGVDSLPSNLGKGLRRLIVWHRAQPHDLSAPERHARLFRAMPGEAPRLQTNPEATRAVVDVTLNGSTPMAKVCDGLTALGAEILARYDRGQAGSIVSADLPLDQAEAAIRVPGVFSMTLVHQPWRRVGKATSQGVDVLQVKKVNKIGFDGAGITVGVISDSFNEGQNTEDYKFTDHAAQDILSGDLPGPGNPFGRTTPVKVVLDGLPGGNYIDEGRAMLQIIHDLAPGANLMFHGAGNTPETLADAINSLRAQTHPACDVIVDDFGFPEEPFFSDGPAALAAHNATANPLVAGQPVVYVSSAGNEGDSAYDADFAPVDNADAREGRAGGNLRLEQVPVPLTLGGFHNFNPKPGKTSLAQQVKVYGDAEVSFQWDDPFIPGEVTADYNLLVFDADGNYLANLSGTDNNPSLGNALEIVDLPLGDNESVTYQFAISRANSGTGLAQHLHYVINGGGAVVAFRGYNHATTFGHNAAADVIGVAAYGYDHLSEPETFSSLGPATIYFDADGNRLATPEVRQQPAVAAVDGVDTTFFPPGPLTLPDGTPGTDTDGDGLPNFFGTSAAAPHVAAVAALLLQAAGGPGSLTPAQVLTLLQSTALPHDLDPNAVSAALTAGDGSTTTLSALADESDGASADSHGFTLGFDGPAGQFLRRLVIDLGPTALKFDPSTDLGFPFTVGSGGVGLAAADVTARLSQANTVLTLNFAPGAFVPGRSLVFGIDRDLISTSTDGNSADLLAGATLKVSTQGTAGVGKARGALVNAIGTGYSPAAGYGLVDARAAVRSLQAHPPVAASQARFVPGDLLLTTSDNRVIETTRSGAVVQVIPVPSPSGGNLGTGAYEAAQESVIDGNGNLAILQGLDTPYLTTINTDTGAVTQATVPGWNLSSDRRGLSPVAGALASLGSYLFANFTQSDATNPLGSLLRYDINARMFQAFGAPDAGTGVNKNYLSLAAGPDGLLYALTDAFYPGRSVLGTFVDVYDPNTLTLVRTIGLTAPPMSISGLEVGRIAVGLAGEIYALSNAIFDPGNVYKCDANGQSLATLTLPIPPKVEANNNGVLWNNLSADAEGNLVVGALEPALIDPSFQTVTNLDVFGSLTPPAGTAVSATFIGP